MKEHRNPKKIDDIEMNKKIFCKKCHEDWGVTALIYNVEWLCIKISSFVLEFPERDRTPRIYKKWKDLPFAIQEADEEEIIRHSADNSETTDLFDLESWRALKKRVFGKALLIVYGKKIAYNPFLPKRFPMDEENRLALDKLKSISANWHSWAGKG